MNAMPEAKLCAVCVLVFGFLCAEARQEIADNSDKFSLDAAYRAGSTPKPTARPDETAATPAVDAGETIAASGHCDECICKDLGVRQGMMRAYWSGTFAATRFEAKSIFGGRAHFNARSGLEHMGFGYMLTDHFELAGALGAGVIKIEEESNAFIDAHLKPMWHFRTRHRIDPYAGLRLGANTITNSGDHLDFLSGGPVIGVNYFLNRRVSVYAETGYSYSHVVGRKDNSLQGHAVTGTIGFSIHFGGCGK